VNEQLLTAELAKWLRPVHVDSPCVRCPHCGCEETHFAGIEYCASLGQPVTVTFAHGEDDPKVRVAVEQGAELSGLGPRETSARRGSVMLVFDGECGHRFGLTFEQHKGNEFLHLRLIDQREYRQR
jgi:hypothetical protein